MDERINMILNHPIYHEHLEKIKKFEIGRSFCRHDLAHFLDTARIGYILNLEQQSNLSKDIIYGAALLHDIGRWQQYEGVQSHDIASSQLCVAIFRDCAYTEDEIKAMKIAILNHCTQPKQEDTVLSKLLYKADKKSRSCFNCNVGSACNWADEKKNLSITY